MHELSRDQHERIGIVMKKLPIILFALILPLAACNKKEAPAPTGQVVATVGSHEITTRDLREEVKSLERTSNNLPNVEELALRTIIARHILADEAVRSKIDRKPEMAILQQRAEQLTLVDALTQKIRGSVPVPSREEVLNYVGEHPATFARRHIFIIDQFIVESPDANLLKSLEKLDLLDEMLVFLDKRKIRYRSTVGTVDAVTIDGEAAEKLAGLAPNAVFINQDGGLVRINRIRDVAIYPLVGEDAIKIASQTLFARRANALVANTLDDIVARGAGTIKYNEAYRADPAKPAP